jgi:hypothetical protein
MHKGYLRLTENLFNLSIQTPPDHMGSRLIMAILREVYPDAISEIDAKKKFRDLWNQHGSIENAVAFMETKWKHKN